MSENELSYDVKLYELENGRWNYYVRVKIRMAQGWSQDSTVGGGSADTEAEAMEQAQEKATSDREERRLKGRSEKVVRLR